MEVVCTQPVLRREGDLHRRARPDVLAGRAARAGAAMSDLTRKEQKAVRTALRLRVGAWGPLAKALRYEWDSIQKVATGKRRYPRPRAAGVPVRRDPHRRAARRPVAVVPSLPPLRAPAGRLRGRGDDRRRVMKCRL
jgi:hypothetical protein